MRRSRLVLLVAAMAMTAAACGARLTPAQIVAATDSETAAGDDATVPGGIEAAEDPLLPGDDPSLPAPDDGGTATTVAGQDPGQAITGPDDTGPATTLPAGGNGGATDVGVTATQIVLGNVSTVNGPVPGLFKGGQAGTQAFAAYINSQGGINGRKLRVVTADDALDANRHRSAVRELSRKVFAFVGMTSGVEHASRNELAATNIPDIGLSLTPERTALPNNFSPEPQRFDRLDVGQFDWFRERHPGAEKKAAVFWHVQSLSKKNADRFKQAMRQVGYEIVYEGETQPTEPNYTSHVLGMRNEGVRFIFTVMEVNSISRLAKAMQQQNFRVDVAYFGAQVYSQYYLDITGSAAEGTTIALPHAMVEDRGQLAEMDLFLTWMERVTPGTAPDIFAMMGWSSGRLFEQAARSAGPQLTRAKLLAELAKIDQFDANGLVAPAGPASKRPPSCFVIATVRDGKWVRVDPAQGGFNCNYQRVVPVS